MQDQIKVPQRFSLESLDLFDQLLAQAAINVSQFASAEEFLRTAGIIAEAKTQIGVAKAALKVEGGAAKELAEKRPSN